MEEEQQNEGEVIDVDAQNIEEYVESYYDDSDEHVLD